jgi:hypothetical protein
MARRAQLRPQRSGAAASLYLEVLPALGPGLTVRIHDIHFL